MDAAYTDTLYVDALIGPDTVNTMPPKTLEAFRDHGTVAETLTAQINAACHIPAEADRLGRDLDGVTDTLVDDGVAAFVVAFDDLMKAIARK